VKTEIKEVDEILRLKEHWKVADNKDDILWNALIALAYQVNDLRNELSQEKGGL